MFSPNIATAKRGESDAGIGMKHENNERELGPVQFSPHKPRKRKKKRHIEYFDTYMKY